MSIPQISTDRPVRSPEVALVLRDGQIVHGKVNKIYPNNRAEIQIGSTRVTAEIVAPLEVGKHYLFQVEQKGAQLIHLKVLGEQNASRIAQNVTELLEQLNIKLTRNNIQFAQMLIDMKIPFQRQQLVDALQLLSQVGFTKENRELVLKMIANQQPLTNPFFQALSALRTQSITEVLEALRAVFSQSESTAHGQQILRLVDQILSRPSGNFANVPLEVQQHMREAVHLLGLLPRGVVENLSNAKQSAEQVGMRNLLLALQVNSQQETVRNDLFHIVRFANSLSNVATELLQKYPLLQSGQLTEGAMQQLSKQIEANLFPLLPANIQKALVSLLTSQQSDGQIKLHYVLTTLRSSEFYALLLEAANTNTNREVNYMQEPAIQARFLQHLQQFLHTSGLSNEASFKTLLLQAQEQMQEIFNQQPALKALVLQYLQDEAPQAERLQQFIHFLNGMQLQAKEMNNMVQVFLQLPGEKLDMLKDISLEFTGRKKADGKIDAEFCRILFVLNLQHIKETIIDMNVQKRVVTLTIYNEYNEQLARMMQPFKTVLKEHLNQLHFHLSHVRWRPLGEDQEPTQKQSKQPVDKQNQEERFDFLV